eukprot:6840176-Pyramimonas_sp.AAC.1
MAKQVRAIKLQLESGRGARIPVFHRVMPWVVRHAGWLLTRFAVRQAAGKTGLITSIEASRSAGRWPRPERSSGP